MSCVGLHNNDTLDARLLRLKPTTIAVATIMSLIASKIKLNIA